MSRLTIRLFGTPSFAFDGAPWRLSALPRCLPLLAYLVLRRELVPRAAVAAALWPDELESDARSNLRRHLHLLKRGLPPPADASWLLDAGNRVGWNWDAPASVDVADFIDRVARAETRADAVALYDGDLLDGYEDEWLVVERERLRTTYLDALLELAALRRRERDFAGAAAFAERLLAHDDLREDAMRELVAARYEGGDRSGALATYERFAARLRFDLHVEPMAETVALHDAVVAGLALHDDAPLPDEHAPAAEREKSPFVGRRSELDALQRAWTRAARRFGGTVILAGEAGIGKSRLCAELAALADRQGGRVLIGATTDPEAGPYQALVAAAQQGLPALPRDGLDDLWASALLSILPEIRAVRPLLGEPPALDDDRARTRLHEALARFFDALARVRPLVLVLEDLHWAHRDTVDAVEALARRASGSALLIVVTYRSEEAGPAHPLRGLARTLQAERRATRVALAPLGGDEIAELVAQTASSNAPDALAPTVARVSEGNPLFAWQLLRGFAETGVLPNGAVHGVVDAIMARVERLPSEVRAVADAAATVGRDFTLELAAAAAGTDESAMSAALDDLIDRHLVRESDAHAWSYTFTHALIASTIYAHTPAERRPARHRRIARVLSEANVADAAALGTLARHWEAAQDAARASAAYQRAAEAAAAVYARAETIDYARRAASLTQDDAARFAALQLAVRAQERGGDPDALRADVEALRACAERLGDGERFAALQSRVAYEARVGAFDATTPLIEAMFGLAERGARSERRAVAFEARGYIAAVRGLLDDAAGPLREALREAERAGLTAEASRIAQRFIQIAIRKGDIAAATEELERRRHVTDASDLQERMHILTAEMTCAFVFEDVDAQRVAGEQLLAVAERIGDVAAEAKARAALAYAAHRHGDVAVMRAHYDRATELLERLGDAHPLVVTVLNRGALELETGRVDNALAFWDRAQPIAERIGAHDGVATLLINRAEALLLAGRAGAALPVARDALAQIETTGERRLIADALVVLGAAEAATGERSGAERIRDGIARARAVGGGASLANDLCVLVETLLATGATDEAIVAAEELEGCRAGAARFPGRAEAALGRVAAARGDAAVAERWFAEGRRLVAARVARFEPADAAAYGDFPFVRALRGERAAAVSGGRGGVGPR
ncbi:MAG: AAA family ATPase [Candidatus Eremiobacteraeota bacterium]|nr:AAA family ATPase [Candidatus Eremiobacteraeota bacterium]